MNEDSTTIMLETMTETQTIATDCTDPSTEPELTFQSHCLHYTGFVLLCVTILGLVIRISLRDSSALLGAVYYALPWPILAALALCAGIIYRTLAKRKTARLLYVLAAGFVVWWCCLTWQVSFAQSELANLKPLRVVFWNVCRGLGGWNGLARELKKQQADIVGLVESGLSHQQIAKHWGPHFKDYHVRYLGRGMTIITRGEIGEIKDFLLAEGSHAYAISVMLEGYEYLVIICDIRSTPWRSRREPIEKLNQIVAANSEKSIILMGDFNTPMDSLHIQTFHSMLHNVFEQSGNGLHVTWPLPLPVHALDQIWVNDHISIQSAELGWSWRSDHRAVITDLHPQNRSHPK